MAWVFLRHPGIGGAQLVVDNADVIGLFEAKGWERADAPDGVDLNDPHAPAGLADALAQAEKAAAEAAEKLAADLKGKALDDALDKAGLSKSGSADEKRARLAEHEAESANTTIAPQEEAE